jgi:hypothetical protein
MCFFQPQSPGVFPIPIVVIDPFAASDTMLYTVTVGNTGNILQKGADGYAGPGMKVNGNCIRLKLQKGSGGMLTVSNLSGQIVCRRAFSPRTNVVNVDISGIPPGVYVLDFTSGVYRECRKLTDW